MIGAGGEDSYLLTKIQANADEGRCGFPMPFLMPAALREEDRQCIVEWVDSVAGAGN